MLPIEVLSQVKDKLLRLRHVRLFVLFLHELLVVEVKLVQVGVHDSFVADHGPVLLSLHLLDDFLCFLDGVHTGSGHVADGGVQK